MDIPIIENKAYQILNQAHIPLEPPIDVMAVAESLEIRVYLAKFADSKNSGFITTNPTLVEGFEPGRKATIVINNQHPLVRQRFTISHEVGHLELGHLKTNEQRNRGEGLPYNATEERDANAFAAALLMPEAPFSEAMYKQNGNLVSVALTFGVSVEATSIRAVALGLLGWENWNSKVVD